MQKDSSTCSVRVSEHACVQLGMCCGMQIVASIKRTHLVSVLFPLSHVATTPRRTTSAAHAPARRSAIFIACPSAERLTRLVTSRRSVEHASMHADCEKLGVTLERERDCTVRCPLVGRLSRHTTTMAAAAPRLATVARALLDGGDSPAMSDGWETVLDKGFEEMCGALLPC